MTALTGGGCKPRGITNQSKAYLERQQEAANERARERAHQWAESSEGRAHAEQMRLREEQEQRRQQEAAAAEQHQREWGERFEALRSHNPQAGVIVIAHNPYTIRVQQDPRNGHVTAYALVRVEGVYPEEPYYNLVSGKKGLKVFLNGAARDHLERIKPKDFDQVRADKEYTAYLESKHSMRVIGVAASGKAVHAEFV